MGHRRSISAVGVDPSAKQLRIELQEVGLTTSIAFDKSMDAGIIRLTELMNSNQFFIHANNGTPTCPHFVKECETLQWDPKKAGKVRDGQVDHFFAAARYGSLIQVSKPEPGALPELQGDALWQAAWRPVMEARKREQFDQMMPYDDDPHGDYGFGMQEDFDGEDDEWP